MYIFSKSLRLSKSLIKTILVNASFSICTEIFRLTEQVKWLEHDRSWVESRLSALEDIHEITPERPTMIEP